MQPIRHVWFDFAGTLFREVPDYKAAHHRLLYETYAKVKGLDDLAVAEREYKVLEQRHGSHSAVFRALGKPSDFWGKELDKLDFRQLLKPNPEVSDTIAAIHKRLPISLFSNYVRYRIEMLLEYLRIPADQFTNILTGDDVAERKPSLVGFRAMVERSQLPANQLLYVGDRVKVDIRPAKQIGMQTCLVYAESPEADYCAEHFRDLLKIIDKS